MKYFVSIICIFSYLLSGCSMPNTSGAEHPLAPSPVPLAAVSEDSRLQTPGSKEADELYMDIESANVHPLEYWETMTSHESIKKVKEVESFIIISAYDAKADKTMVSINDQALIPFKGSCEMRGSVVDLTQDGNKELILFLWPTMSNLALGDLYVFSGPEELKELLVYSGQGPESAQFEPGRPILSIPDGFSYSDDSLASSGYNTLCIGVDVLQVADRNILRIVHQMNERECAYSYAVWDNGLWNVILQELVQNKS